MQNLNATVKEQVTMKISFRHRAKRFSRLQLGLTQKIWIKAIKPLPKQRSISSVTCATISCWVSKRQVMKEWRLRKITQNSFYSKMESRQLREKILNCKRNKFSNFHFHVELALRTSASNSKEEQAFSILSDQAGHQKKMKCYHYDFFNHFNWSKMERQKLFKRAFNLYMEIIRTAFLVIEGLIELKYHQR